ncbi:MAG: S8 family serine peptidase [Planctomycetes bacterium]|nr:S8 family serine peptidase [Planctomycetota bacterium]
MKPVKVWFEEQLLGVGNSYALRIKDFKEWKRSDLRKQVVHTLMQLSDKYYSNAKDKLIKLENDGYIKDIRKHWIINGFSCWASKEGVNCLKQIPGVKNIFHSYKVPSKQINKSGPEFIKEVAYEYKDELNQSEHPWTLVNLKVLKARKEFGVTGNDILTVIHDYGFKLDVPVLVDSLWRNVSDTPNGIDDDGNGYVDDHHGFNFDSGTSEVNIENSMKFGNTELSHGNICAGIVCARGTNDPKIEVGVAPKSKWIPLIAFISNIEQAVEWSIEHNADIYSMSFSLPGLGELRSHWRKIMEHATLCGIIFVSGAGNFGNKNKASYAPVPIQMRIPEDIPEVVFGVAGLDKNHNRPKFSSQGPVEWLTEHYNDGTVKKPDIVTFNKGFPVITQDGKIFQNSENTMQGNSFAGPHLCGVIALMLSADKEILPWTVREIIINTATDVLDPGFDYQSGYGLVDAYEAVREVLKRKAIREGKDPTPYMSKNQNDSGADKKK